MCIHVLHNFHGILQLLAPALKPVGAQTSAQPMTNLLHFPLGKKTNNLKTWKLSLCIMYSGQSYQYSFKYMWNAHYFTATERQITTLTNSNSNTRLFFQNFWRDLFKDAKSWGLSMYEQVGFLAVSMSLTRHSWALLLVFHIISYLLLCYAIKPHNLSSSISKIFLKTNTRKLIFH